MRQSTKSDLLMLREFDGICDVELDDTVDIIDGDSVIVEDVCTLNILLLVDAAIVDLDGQNFSVKDTII